MAEIIVTTKVEIKDELGREILSITRRSDKIPAAGGNSRFFSTYTRGACQENELAISEMLINQFGDKP